MVLSALLVGVDALDELSAGIPVVAAPGIRSAFGLRYTGAALVLFVLPQLVALLLEPPLYLLADRLPRRRLVAGGLLALGICDLVAGLSGSLLPFAAALALAGTAAGVGSNLAQATLMDRHPGERERMMALWSLAGVGGDLAAPALLWALARLGLGWRGAFLVSAALLFAYAAALGRQSFPRPGGDVEDVPPLWQALRSALGNRRLLAWLLGVFLCDLLDEILVALASLHLRDHLGLDAAQRSAVLMGFAVGGALGLMATEGLLRRGVDPLALLRASGSACALVYGAWILAPGMASSALLLAGVGLTAAPLYPIVQAQAYRALPGRSGMVNAVAAAFGPLQIALPLGLGLVADRWGLGSALALLAAQPMGLALAGWLAPRQSIGHGGSGSRSTC